MRSSRPLLVCTAATLAALASACSSSSSTGGKVDASSTCYPDNDGITGGTYILELTVDDTGFSKNILSTQNDGQVTLTLKNVGTKKHGFSVGCTTAVAPAGCSTRVCFPDDSTIEPIEPNTSKTITFDTPTPDGIVYPFMSSEPNDANVAGLNRGQWSLM